MTAIFDAQTIGMPLPRCVTGFSKTEEKDLDLYTLSPSFFYQVCTQATN